MQQKIIIILEFIQSNLTDVLSYSYVIQNLSIVYGNDDINNIRQCSEKKCKFKEYFRPVFNIVSSFTKRSYDCIVPAGKMFYLQETAISPI